MSDVTKILQSIESGNTSAAEDLLPLVYDELRKLATARIANESPGQTLQGTALVHEAYVRLVDQSVPQRWDGRGHFFAAAAEAMRRILVEQARKKKKLKRGGDLARVDLLEHDLAIDVAADEVLAIDDSLERLSRADPLAAQVLKLKYYGGMSVDEAAVALGVLCATAYRCWTYARAWVRAEVLEDESAE